MYNNMIINIFFMTITYYLGGDASFLHTRFVWRNNPRSNPNIEAAGREPDNKEKENKPDQGAVDARKKEFSSVCAELEIKLEQYKGFSSAEYARSRLKGLENEVKKPQVTSAEMGKHVAELRRVLQRIPVFVSKEISDRVNMNAKVFIEEKEKYNKKLKEIAAEAKKRYENQPEIADIVRQALGQAVYRNESFWAGQNRLLVENYNRLLGGVQAGNEGIAAEVLKKFEDMESKVSFPGDDFPPVANSKNFEREIDGKVILAFSSTQEKSDKYLAGEIEKLGKAPKIRLSTDHPFNKALEDAKVASDGYSAIASENKGYEGRSIRAMYFARVLDLIDICRSELDKINDVESIPAEHYYEDAAVAAIDATRKFDESKDRWEKIAPTTEKKYEFAGFKRNKKWRLHGGAVLYHPGKVETAEGDEDKEKTVYSAFNDKALLGTRIGTLRAGTVLTVDSDKLLNVPGLGFVVKVTLADGRQGYILRDTLPLRPIAGEKEEKIEKKKNESENIA